jgi:hypothetical protein
MNLENALAAVKAAGYRVSKPRMSKRGRVGPTCVVRFADGETFRMSTFCLDNALDVDRGVRLCGHAWQSRKKCDAPAPPVVSVHFERDGERLVLGDRP